MDKEEISHLKHDTAQLQEIAKRFYHADPEERSESSSHSISNPQSIDNVDADIASDINPVKKDELLSPYRPGKPLFLLFPDHSSMIFHYLVY